jgi:hypothetical protein
MPLFKKKPVVIEAEQFVFTEAGLKRLYEFCGSALGNYAKPHGRPAEIQVGTLEDGDHFRTVHVATEGDWIIKGVQGEFYPCKPDIFEQTYERVEES